MFTILQAFNTFVEPYYYVTTFITKICNCEIFQSYFSIFLPFLVFGPNLLMLNFINFHSDVGVTHEAALFLGIVSHNSAFHLDLPFY